MAHFSGELWPVHPRRFPDELLSFWILRVAHANRVKLQTFTNTTFPRTESPWAKDIDRSASPAFIERLSLRTGASVEEIKGGMLTSYEGTVFERHNEMGNTPWVLPLGVYHRTRRAYGMQFCPQCLFWDEEPYFRRRWRLAFVTICDKHGNLLHDRCPQCEAPVVFFRNDLGHRKGYSLADHTRCWQCGFDLRRSPVWGADWLDAQSYITLKSLITFIDSGMAVAGQHLIAYAHLFLEALHCICRMLTSSGRYRRYDQFQAVVSEITGSPLPAPVSRAVFEQLGLSDRHRVLLSALWLLSGWPSRLVDTCRRSRMFRPSVVGDAVSIPYWFDSELRYSLDGSQYTPNFDEVLEVERYLRKTGQRVSKRSVAAKLGRANSKVVRSIQVQGNIHEATNQLGCGICSLSATPTTARRCW